MQILSIVLCIWNIIFGIISFVPCIMGAAMGADSPQAQKDPLSILLCYLFLSFPVICIICGLSSLGFGLFGHYKTAIVVGLWPILEAALVVSLLYFFGNN